jgi:hypothetical protein
MENNALLQIIPNLETGEITIEVPGYSGPILVEIYTRQNALVYEISTEMKMDYLRIKPGNLISSLYRFRITTELLHWEQLIEL